MDYWESGDEYCYDDTGVLINKHDIREREKLDKLESASFNANIPATVQMLQDTPLENLTTLATLQKIHEMLFGDVYEWAGKIRTVRISKGETVFCYPEQIENEAKKGFSFIHGNDFTLENLAKSFGYINVVHPFREGNGRTQKWLYTEILNRHGYTINWGLIDNEEFLNACISDYNGDDGRALYKIINATI